MSESVSKGQARFSAMAHLFLSDLRSPKRTPEGNEERIAADNPGRPQRVGPCGKDNSYPPPQQRTDPPLGADPSVFSNPPEPEDQTLASLAAQDVESAEEGGKEKMRTLGVHC